MTYYYLLRIHFHTLIAKCLRSPVRFESFERHLARAYNIMNYSVVKTIFGRRKGATVDFVRWPALRTKRASLADMLYPHFLVNVQVISMISALHFVPFTSY